jgi:hypothetical protein
VPYVSTTAAQVWSHWCSTATTSTATVWEVWTAESATSTNSSILLDTASTTVWTNWVRDAEGWTQQIEWRSAAQPPRVHPAPRVLTADEIAARDARRREAERVAAVSARERLAAIRRAEVLLRGNLSPEQLRQFDETRSFIVIGRDGRRFRIREGRTANIDLVNPEGIVESRLCAHPRDDVPDCDTMLAQKLLLEDDEQHFLRLANRHPVLVRGQRVLPPMQ